MAEQKEISSLRAWTVLLGFLLFVTGVIACGFKFGGLLGGNLSIGVVVLLIVLLIRGSAKRRKELEAASGPGLSTIKRESGIVLNKAEHSPEVSELIAKLRSIEAQLNEAKVKAKL